MQVRMLSLLSRLITPRVVGGRCLATRGIFNGMTSKTRMMKVTVVGAAGNVGQPLSLMLKQSPLLDGLAVYDIESTQGLGLDLSYVDTKCHVVACTGVGELPSALQDAKIVVIVASGPQNTHDSANAYFQAQAKMMEFLAEACVDSCPEAVLAVVSEPVNSLVPLICEVFARAGIPNSLRVLGVTALDVVRANTFLAGVMGFEPESVLVPVVGGRSPTTLVPLLSQARPRSDLSNVHAQKITLAVQEATAEVRRARAGEGIVALSAAFAVARFVLSVARGMCGHAATVECAYTVSSLMPGVSFLAAPVELGPLGVQRTLPLPEMSEYERSQMDAAIPRLLQDIERGTRFVVGDDPPKSGVPPCPGPVQPTVPLPCRTP